MKSKIKVSDTWLSGKPRLKTPDVWLKVKRALVKQEGAWKVSFDDEFVIELSGAHTNFNLYSKIGLPEAETIIVEVKAGATLSAADSAVPAFKLGNPYHGKKVIIRNRGSILGRGGRGGGGGGASGARGGNGAAGGTALYLREAAHQVTLVNHGRIAGGGGGGGGGGGIKYGGHIIVNPTDPSRAYPFDFSHSGSRGGNGGTGGNGQAASRLSWTPYSSAQTRAIAGNGGNGGNQGSAGASGGKGSTYTKPQVVGGVRVIGAGGRGGRAGYAIDGKSKVTIETVGSITGSQVN